MQPKILPITIDLYDHTTEHKDYVLVSNDTKAYLFDFSIVEKRKPYDLSDISLISIVFKRKDGQPVYSECTIDDAANGKVSYLVKTTEISVPGTVVAELQFYGSDGERLTSVNFTFKVRDALDSGDGVVSDTNYPILTDLIQKTATAISDTNQAASNANQKAQLAEEKATEAQTAADNANNARENIQTMWDNLSTAQQEEAEVINMRTSIARGKSFPQATDRLEEIEEEVFNHAYLTEEFTSSIHSFPSTVEKGQISVESIKGNTITNLIQNGSFENDSTGWLASQGSIAVINGQLEFTENTVTSEHYVQQTYFKPIVGHTYFAITSVKNGGRISIFNKEANGDYYAQHGNYVTGAGLSCVKCTISTVYSEPAMLIRLYGKVGSYTGTGVKYYFDNIFLIDITENSLENKTDDELIKMFPYYFDGTKSTLGALRLTSTVNLFNKKDFITYVKTYDNTAYVTTENGHEVIEYTIHRLHDKPFMKGMFKPNTQYRFNITWRVTGSTAHFVVKYTDGSISILGRVNSTTYQTNKSNSTAGKSIDYIFLSYGSAPYRVRIQLDTLMITEGNQDVEYSEYGVGGSMYTKATDENGNILPMRSLPNGTKDELYADANGKYCHKQNVSDDTAISDTVYDSIDTTTYTNVDVIKTTAFSDAKAGTTAADGMTRYYDKNGIELIEVAQADIDLETSVGKYYWHTDKTLWIIVDKGTYADISAARTGLGTTSLNYQLLNPVVRPATVVGHLDSYPNGTIIVETGIVHDFDFYDEVNGIQIADINNPIQKLETVIWTDKETGYEIDITDTCTVAADGLGFTSTYAVEGDLIWYAYKTTKDSTQPTVSIKAPLNSRTTLEDLVKAKSEIQNKVDNVDLRVQSNSNRIDNVTADLADSVNYVQSQNPIGKVKYIGHRGASLIAPENTLPSYELAGELGFWGVECDIYTSKDGVWVLHHDDTVDRMTNGTGKVSDKTLAELKSLTIDAGNNISLYPNLKIPTLEEYLYVCKKWGMVPVIGIKAANNTSDYDSLINLLKKLDFETKAIIISFNRTALTEVRNRSKKIVLQLVTSSMTIDDLNFVKSLGNAMMDTYYTSATKENIELCHSNGILINTWTVDNFNTAKTLETNGIDFITSNILCG